MKTRLFISSTTCDGFPMLICGKSVADNLDYSVETNNLHSHEIPDEVTDAKDCSQFIAGLLNAYYNNVDVSNMEAADIMRMGLPESELGISCQKEELPF